MSTIREINNTPKKVYLKDIGQNKIMEADIYPLDTVRQLKRMIEKKFNYDNNHLNGYHPRLINKGYKTGTLLEDDEKTLAEYDIQNLAVIQFNKLKNKGGY